MSEPDLRPDELELLRREFACTRRGGCCTGSPGLVRLTESEARAMADHLGLPFGGFGARHLRTVNGRLALVERADGDCTFHTRDERGRGACSVHPARPEQCRTWPFWPRTLASAEALDETRQACPGLDRAWQVLDRRRRRERRSDVPAWARWDPAPADGELEV